MDTALAPVSVCLIVRDESAQLEACLKSIRPYVAEICIVDTGSTDSTPDIARQFADKFEVYTGCNDDQGQIASFSDARNRSFAMATQPWVMWVDGDDEVIGAEKLLDLIKDTEKGAKGPISVMFPYEYSHDANGRPNCVHYRERLISPKSAFLWRDPVHEVLSPVGPCTTIRSESVIIVHKKDWRKKSKTPERNLRIMKALYEKQGERDARHLYYLANEYADNNDVENAIKFYSRYVELSGWDDEKYMACLRVVRIYRSLGRYDDAIQWALRASTIKETWSEAYFELAKCYYFVASGSTDPRRQWERCAHFARLGLSYPPTKTNLFVNPLERTYEIHRYLNVALNWIGDVKGALESTEIGLAACPDDENLLLNRSIYVRWLLSQELSSVCNRMKEAGMLTNSAHDDMLRIGRGESVCRRIDRTGPGSLDIVFYVGGSIEPWNPVTVARTGIGGSETAVIEMSKRLARMGHRVRVYGDCAMLEGTFDGVEYLHHTKFRGINCDVLITSRRPEAVDDAYGVKARAIVCWVHDVHCGPALTHARAIRINRFLCLTTWHRNYFLSQYKYIHGSQVHVTRNGINLDRFASPKERNPHKAVYSSSPDRGLQVALEEWPSVRRRVPDAELHVFYGFDNWVKSTRHTGDAGQAKLIESLQDLIKDRAQHGVIYHGRVDQNTLANHFMDSGVWAYPTFFTETSCITAMEAQAAGLRIVTSPIAALTETVADRGILIDGNWLSAEYRGKFVDAVVDAMTKPDGDDRQQLISYARDNFSWDGVAEDWNKMFPELIDEAESNLIPPYAGIL